MHQDFLPPGIVILTGAGISKESGVDTFRDQDGLWAGTSTTRRAALCRARTDQGQEELRRKQQCPT
jgi:NAD-dependent SIR2 family protein deacetylase